MEQTSSPSKTAETVPTPTSSQASSSAITTAVVKTSVQEGNGKGSAPEEKKNGEKEAKQGKKQPEIAAIESDAEFLIDDQAKGSP